MKESNETINAPANRITAAAIMRSGAVFTGLRHGLIIKEMVDTGFLTDINKPVLDREQGFVDSNGIYWDRQNACVIAKSAGQVLLDHGTLYSEDLW